MSERINTPFTNEHFADWCLKMAAAKSVYWYVNTTSYNSSLEALSKYFYAALPSGRSDAYIYVSGE